MIGYVIETDGTARMLSHQETHVALDLGMPIFGTLAGAVIHGGVAATAFDRPAISEEVMSGRKWVELQAFRPEGLCLSLRVCAENGRLVHPPRQHRGMLTPFPDPDLAASFAGISAWVGCYFGALASPVVGPDPASRDAAGRAIGNALPSEGDCDPDPVPGP